MELERGRKDTLSSFCSTSAMLGAAIVVFVVGGVSICK